MGSSYSQELSKVLEYTREPSPYDRGVCSYKLIGDFITLMTFNVLLSYQRVLVSWPQILSQSQSLVTWGCWCACWETVKSFFLFFSFSVWTNHHSLHPLHLFLVGPKELLLQQLIAFWWVFTIFSRDLLSLMVTGTFGHISYLLILLKPQKICVNRFLFPFFFLF